MNTSLTSHRRRAAQFLSLVATLVLTLSPGAASAASFTAGATAVASDSASPAAKQPAKRSVVIRGPELTTAGDEFTLRGRVTKTPKRSPVRIEYSVDGSDWKFLWRVTTNAKGRYSYTTEIGRDIAVAYRAVAEKVGKRKAVKSPSIIVIGVLDLPE